MKNNPNDPYTEKVLKEFDNTLVDWNSPRFLADGKTIDDVKSFITHALLTQRNEIKERIEGMKIRKETGDDDYVFNQALEQALQAIEGKEKE